MTPTAKTATQGMPQRAGLVPIDRKHLLILGCVTVVAYAICFLITIQYKDYWYSVRNSNDSFGYIAIARSLRHWDPRIIGHPSLFWGTGYAILAFSPVTGGDFEIALAAISVICCLVGILFCYRLFGVGVAAWFVFIDPAMMSRSMLGGSEPLFIAFFLGALVALRKGWFYVAVLLAALSTTVRPIGVFLIIAILIGAMREKAWGQVARGSAIAAAVGSLYCIPLILLFGDPLANISGYRTDWYQASLPITLPLFPIVKEAILSFGKSPLSTTLRIGVSVLAVLTVIAYRGLIRGELFRRWRTYPTETLGIVLVVLFCLSYNSSWAWAEFPRFIVPAVPFLLALVGTKRLYNRALWVAVPFFGALGATYIVGFQRVVQSIRGAIG